jgi:anti-sigma factor RsiW
MQIPKMMDNREEIDCLAVRELLSAYHDGELSPEMRFAAAKHLAQCEHCTCELEAFGELSNWTHTLAQPASPPADLWPRVEEMLSGAGLPTERRAARFGFAPTKRHILQLAIALAAAIAVAVSWFGFRTPSSHVDEHAMAAVFGEYLDEFRRDPRAAQQVLLSQYDGQLLNAGQVAARLGYRPAIATGLPDGYTLEATYFMKMPCCDCIQCLCRRSDGTVIAIFEHDDEQADWFGDRPTSSTMCNDTRCSLVQLQDRIAASWRRGNRHVTVIGARDTAEVDQLVAWFEGGHRR